MWKQSLTGSRPMVSFLLEVLQDATVRLDSVHFHDAMQGEWYAQYLPIILDPVNGETIYHPWLYIVFSRGS